MILPTKHISTRNSLLGIGATILVHLNSPRTVTSLWNSVSKAPEIGTFERFVLALDLLYMLGAVEIQEGLLHRCH
jgi:hypothetical protein